MAIANGHQGHEPLVDEKEKNHGLVEIVEPNDRAYFKAQLLDINPELRQYFVRYEGEDEGLWLDSARVRVLPPPRSAEERALFQPRSGDLVEVSFSEDDQIESWWEGEILQGKGDFFLVTFSDQSESPPQEIVERERLRPAYGHNLAIFEKVLIPIKPELQADVKVTEDTLVKVAKLANLFALRLSERGDQLIALGSARAVETARGIIEIHLKKVPDIAKKARIALDLQSKVRAEQSKLSNGTLVSYNVDRENIGRMIGYNGSNVRAAKAIPGIIRIDFSPDGILNIHAESREKAQLAFERLNVITVTVSVKPEEVGFIIGKKGQQIQELEQMSGCTMNVEQNSSNIVITGSRSDTEKAKALLDYILGALEEQRKKEEEIAALSGELRSMGVNSAGFFNSGLRRGNDRGRGRFGRGGAVGRGVGGSGFDSAAAQYAIPGAERNVRGGAVFARGGRGGRGRGNVMPASAQSLSSGVPPAGGGGESQGVPGAGRASANAGRAVNGPVVTVQRTAGVNVLLGASPAPQQPPPQSQLALQQPRQAVHPASSGPRPGPNAPAGSSSGVQGGQGRGAANIVAPRPAQAVGASQQHLGQQPAVSAPAYKARGGSSAKANGSTAAPPQHQQRQQLEAPAPAPAPAPAAVVRTVATRAPPPQQPQQQQQQHASQSIPMKNQAPPVQQPARAQQQQQSQQQQSQQQQRPQPNSNNGASRPASQPAGGHQPPSAGPGASGKGPVHASQEAMGSTRVVANGPMGANTREKSNAPAAASQSHDSAPLPQRPRTERVAYVPAAQSSAPGPAAAQAQAVSAAGGGGTEAAARSDAAGPQSLRGKLAAQGSVEGGVYGRGGTGRGSAVRGRGRA